MIFKKNFKRKLESTRRFLKQQCYFTYYFYNSSRTSIHFYRIKPESLSISGGVLKVGVDRLLWDSDKEDFIETTSYSVINGMMEFVLAPDIKISESILEFDFEEIYDYFDEDFDSGLFLSKPDIYKFMKEALGNVAYASTKVPETSGKIYLGLDKIG